jgi:nucleotide-binding universal stress UspA family protein
MKWIIGIDLRSGDGPVRFARWIQETSRAPDGEQLVFVHVLEEEHLRFVLRQHHIDEVTEGARREGERLLAAEGARGEIRIAQGLTAEDALEKIRAQVQGDAVILGRAAPRAGRHVVRLGRVARRMLRRLDSPVVVVPPDLRADQIGDGPIAVLTSLADDALAACRFAAATAPRLGRPLVALHAARTALAAYLPASATTSAGDGGTEAAAALDAWLECHAIRPQGREVLLGSPVEVAAEWGERERAPLLVTGSRRLSDAGRIIHSSTGSSLAATAAAAIAVVPP